MFLIKLYHFIFGYATLKITGIKPERFINMIMNLRIKFWGIERFSDENTNGLCIKIPSRYAKEAALYEAANKTNTKCDIISKKGIRYLLERHKYRLGIYLGVVIGVTLIYISTFFIWDVKIVKSDYNNNVEVIEILEKLGCKNGAFIKNIDVKELQDRAVLNSNGKITWLAVNIKGTVAYIEIKKREPPEKINDRKTPANIIASKSGKIIYIDTYDGQQMVEKDVAVQKGDLLISGAVNSEMLGMRIKHASGKVLAETTRTIEVIIPLDSTEKIYTGNETGKISLNIFGKNINLYLKNDVSFEKYNKIKDVKNLTLFDAVVLPVKVSTSIYKEFEVKNIKIDENTAKALAISKINCIIDSEFGGDENIIEIKSKNYEGEYCNEQAQNYYYMKCTVDCVENIAEEMPFDTNIKTES